MKLQNRFRMKEKAEHVKVVTWWPGLRGLRGEGTFKLSQIKYSFVLMLISLISLATMGTIQKNISTKVRPVGLIDINTNVCAAIYESGL